MERAMACMAIEEYDGLSQCSCAGGFLLAEHLQLKGIIKKTEYCNMLKKETQWLQGIAAFPSFSLDLQLPRLQHVRDRM